jgi:hypothetical protein
VAQKAISDLKTGPAFSMAGTGADSGSRISVHLSYKQGTGCEGTIGEGADGGLTMVVIGLNAWLKPDTTFWKSQAGSSASQVIALLGGKYLKVSISDRNFSSPTQLWNVIFLVSQLSVPTNVSKGTVTTLNGQQVLPLHDKKKDGGTMYVTDTSVPRIVRVVNTEAGDNEALDFTYGSQVSLTAPPASQTIDGSKSGF